MGRGNRYFRNVWKNMEKRRWTEQEREEYRREAAMEENMVNVRRSYGAERLKQFQQMDKDGVEHSRRNEYYREQGTRKQPQISEDEKKIVVRGGEQQMRDMQRQQRWEERHLDRNFDFNTWDTDDHASSHQQRKKQNKRIDSMMSSNAEQEQHGLNNQEETSGVRGDFTPRFWSVTTGTKLTSVERKRALRMEQRMEQKKMMQNAAKNKVKQKQYEEPVAKHGSTKNNRRTNPNHPKVKPRKTAEELYMEAFGGPDSDGNDDSRHAVSAKSTTPDGRNAVSDREETAWHIREDKMHDGAGFHAEDNNWQDDVVENDGYWLDRDDSAMIAQGTTQRQKAFAAEADADDISEYELDSDDMELGDRMQNANPPSTSYDTLGINNFYEETHANTKNVYHDEENELSAEDAAEVARYQKAFNEGASLFSQLGMNSDEDEFGARDADGDLIDFPSSIRMGDAELHQKRKTAQERRAAELAELAKPSKKKRNTKQNKEREKSLKRSKSTRRPLSLAADREEFLRRLREIRKEDKQSDPAKVEKFRAREHQNIASEQGSAKPQLEQRTKSTSARTGDKEMDEQRGDVKWSAQGSNARDAAVDDDDSDQIEEYYRLSNEQDRSTDENSHADFEHTRDSDTLITMSSAAGGNHWEEDEEDVDDIESYYAKHADESEALVRKQKIEQENYKMHGRLSTHTDSKIRNKKNNNNRKEGKITTVDGIKVDKSKPKHLREINKETEEDYYSSLPSSVQREIRIQRQRAEQIRAHKAKTASIKTDIDIEFAADDMTLKDDDIEEDDFVYGSGYKKEEEPAVVRGSLQEGDGFIDETVPDDVPHDESDYAFLSPKQRKAKGISGGGTKKRQTVLDTRQSKQQHNSKRGVKARKIKVANRNRGAGNVVERREKMEQQKGRRKFQYKGRSSSQQRGGDRRAGVAHFQVVTLSSSDNVALSHRAHQHETHQSGSRVLLPTTVFVGMMSVPLVLGLYITFRPRKRQ